MESAEALPVWPLSAVPVLSGEQMRDVDRLMIDELHIDLVQMMENAGRSLAELALARFEPASVTVLAGPGGNGGGGIAPAALYAAQASHETTLGGPYAGSLVG